MVAGQYKLGKEEYTKRWRATSDARCLSKEYKSEYMLEWHRRNPEKYILKGARKRAEKKGMSFEIDESDIIIPESCPVLGIKLTEVRSSEDGAPSLDRRDNSLGYIKGNVFVISTRANNMKSNMSLEDIRRLHKYALPAECS
jgi:hypothetical protein